VIGDRWTLLVLRDLLLGPLRFGDLVEGLPGIGTNPLAARLKHLELTGVVQRRLLPLPERGTSYELSEYGRELEPIVMALGRWGARSMGRLPADVTTRSRWLVAAMLAFHVAAMLAFHDESRRIDTPTTWELRLSDGPFTVRAEGATLAAVAGAPAASDLVLTTADETMHRLLTRRLPPDEAVASGVVTLHGERAALGHLLDLFVFPALAPESVL
jgi:DNA-binding HxlR family transcriptional regulator